jgi:UPF0176 protein
MTDSSTKPYRVLLYYKYVPIDGHEAFASGHLAFCRSLELKGRILIASEGINGTLSGTVEQTDAYIAAMRDDPRFADMVFKIDEADRHVFRKLKVKARHEIVTLGLEDDIDPNSTTGRYLAPEEFHRALQQEGAIVIDARNYYEYDLGHFRNAIRPEVKTFKEFPQWVRENLSAHKDRPILTYCTGGIRCEKFSGFLLKEGFTNVSQLHGGIVTYGKDERVKGELFDGRCYVFDERVSVPVNRTEQEMIVSRCRHCDAPSDRYVNCANLDCDMQYFCCEECEPSHRRSCSKECQEASRHEYDLRGEYSYYRKKVV